MLTLRTKIALKKHLPNFWADADSYKKGSSSRSCPAEEISLSLSATRSESLPFRNLQKPWLGDLVNSCLISYPRLAGEARTAAG